MLFAKQVIERTASQRASSPTLTLIEELTLRRDISVGHVYFALVDLRHAASNIIEENLPGEFNSVFNIFV